jgi:hypothetical protein
MFHEAPGRNRRSCGERDQTPAHDIMVSKTFKTSKGPLTKDVGQHIPESRTASITAAAVAPVNAVLDRFRDGLHLQTLFPATRPRPTPPNGAWAASP